MSKSTRNRSRAQPLERSSTWDGIIHEQARNGLTRERIVTAGIAIADEHGLPAVSIRKIAAKLDASAMALYHYVPSKRDLLNLMLDASNADFEWPAETITGWREALSHYAWESRRCLKRHPWVSALRANDPEYGPECIRILEALLTSLSRFGLDVRTSIRVLGVLFVFVNGFVAAESVEASGAQRRGQQRAGRQPVFSRAILATGNFPNVARFIQMGAELPNDQAFERALNWVLSGMASDIESAATTSARGRSKKGC